MRACGYHECTPHCIVHYRYLDLGYVAKVGTQVGEYLHDEMTLSMEGDVYDEYMLG